MNKAVLPQVQRVHFVGIGGSGMSPLAEILHAQGYTVTGSDMSESDNTARMRRRGIPVYVPQAADNLGDAELVVYTAAVSADNPERLAAAQRGIPQLERAVLLGSLSHAFPTTVAVAGTHGKTTTSAMLSHVLLQAGRDPSVFIGGRLPLIDANGRAGESDLFVCEACEFQDHYLSMDPAVSIILNVDADHLEYFGSLDGVIHSFTNFAQKTTRALLVNGDDENTLRAVQDITHVPVIRFGLSDGCEWQARGITTHDGAYGCYELYHGGEKLADVRLGVAGKHNILNSLGVAAAAHLCGATTEEIVRGLADFHGAGRRFEMLGTFRGVTVVDDYAHHPTEIEATLRTAKQLPYNRVWAVFQPFTYSRTARHLEAFARTLSLADEVVVSEIMGSRETNQWNVYSEQITDRIDGAHYLATFDEIVDFVAAHAREGDLVVTMGGGNIYQCARMLCARLQ